MLLKDKNEEEILAKAIDDRLDMLNSVIKRVTDVHENNTNIVNQISPWLQERNTLKNIKKRLIPR